MTMIYSFLQSFHLRISEGAFDNPVMSHWETLFSDFCWMRNSICLWIKYYHLSVYRVNRNFMTQLILTYYFYSPFCESLLTRNIIYMALYYPILFSKSTFISNYVKMTNFNNFFCISWIVNKILKVTKTVWRTERIRRIVLICKKYCCMIYSFLAFCLTEIQHSRKNKNKKIYDWLNLSPLICSNATF